MKKSVYRRSFKNRSFNQSFTLFFSSNWQFHMKCFKMDFADIVLYSFVLVHQIFLSLLFCSHWNSVIILFGNKALKSRGLRFNHSFVSQILSQRDHFIFLYVLLHCPNSDILSIGYNSQNFLCKSLIQYNYKLFVQGAEARKYENFHSV